MSAFSPVRILVAEDFLAFRQFLCTILQGRPEWAVVFEASDGLEAVQKSAELQPDLILLDISLPKLDGIEAARNLVRLCPQSKILFVSQESSNDVVREALSVGARGYLLKSHAQTELLIAIEAILAREQFVSSELRLCLRLEALRSTLPYRAALCLLLILLPLASGATPTRFRASPTPQWPSASFSAVQDRAFTQSGVLNPLILLRDPMDFPIEEITVENIAIRTRHKHWATRMMHALTRAPLIGTQFTGKRICRRSRLASFCRSLIAGRTQNQDLRSGQAFVPVLTPGSTLNPQNGNAREEKIAR